MFAKFTMAISQARSDRSVTGSKYKNARTKRLHELGSLPTLTALGARKIISLRTAGANRKYKTIATDAITLSKKDGTSVVAKILNIIETPANRNFVRRNIMTKGSVIETDKGKARITSRPGQEASLSGVLL